MTDRRGAVWLATCHRPAKNKRFRVRVARILDDAQDWSAEEIADQFSVPVEFVRRMPDRVLVKARGALPERFDQVFIACHADEALRLLADATPAEREQIRRNLGLDEPVQVQLVKWYGGLLHGDLGRSLFLGKPVAEATFERLPVSLSLSAYALVLTLVLGIVSGVLAALRQNSWVDQAAMMFA